MNKRFGRQVRGFQNLDKQEGLTLIEVLIAVIIMAMIGTISYQSLDATIRSKVIIEEHIADLARIDRAWLLIEADIRNMLNHSVTQTSGRGGQLHPLVLANNDEEYFMTILRGGHANPLNFIRSEVIRVGYRVQEEILWRDVWYNIGSSDVDEARQQKIIEGVDEIKVRVLSPNATSFSAGPWQESWSLENDHSTKMPIAVEITLILKDDESEITRLFALVNGQ